jgi:hypothetical protein
MTQTHNHSHPNRSDSRSRSNSFRFPLPPGKQLRHINTRISGYVNNDSNSSEESLYLPIQYPSPIEPRLTDLYIHIQKNVTHKPVPVHDAGRVDSPALPPHPFPIAPQGRRDSDTLGQYELYRLQPSETLKSSRVDLLRHKLVPQIYSPNARVASSSQEQLNAINLRCEPDRSIRTPVSAEGKPQPGIYQAPAQMPWSPQSINNPQALLQQVRAELKLTRSQKVIQRGVQPRQQLMQRQRSQAQPQYTQIKDWQRERAGLQYTQQSLNGRNELGGYVQPLHPSREHESTTADLFEREYQARLNGQRRRLPAQKPQKSNAAMAKMVEGKGGFVPMKASVEHHRPQQEVGGWFEDGGKSSFGRKLKILLAKILHHGQNKWQRLSR